MAAENTTQILQENDTCWRVARCGRARVLIDAADYFLAVRRAFLNALHRIFLVGWDIDRRTRLVGAGGEAEKDADLPGELCALLPANPEGRRAGNQGDRPCRSRASPEPSKTKTTKTY